MKIDKHLIYDKTPYKSLKIALYGVFIWKSIIHASRTIEVGVYLFISY